MKGRLLAATLCYVILGAVATLTLGGKPLAFVLLFLAALAAKTWIHSVRSE